MKLLIIDIWNNCALLALYWFREILQLNLLFLMLSQLFQVVLPPHPIVINNKIMISVTFFINYFPNFLKVLFEILSSWKGFWRLFFTELHWTMLDFFSYTRFIGARLWRKKTWAFLTSKIYIMMQKKITTAMTIMIAISLTIIMPSPQRPEKKTAGRKI